MSASNPDYNPFTAEFVLNPYPTFARLRAPAPVFYSPVLGSWIVLSYEAITAALRDRTFSSRNSIRTDEEFPDYAREIFKKGGYAVARGPVNSDGEQHTRLRGLVTSVFTTSWIASLDPMIRRSLESLLDSTPTKEGGVVDLVELFKWFPLLVICQALGIPPADREQVLAWCRDWSQITTGPNLPPEQLRPMAESYAAFQRYAAGMIDERRLSPRDDALSALIQADFQGGFSTDEIISVLMQLVFAGHQTVGDFLPQLFHVLLEEGRWETLDPGDERALEHIIDEGLRYRGSVLGMFRTTTREVALGGVSIPAGATVELMYASGNHDPAVFPTPERFDPGRANVGRHLTFGGHGIHFCLGAPLGKLEARIALQTLRQRYPRLRLVPHFAPAYVQSVIMRGLQALPVETAPTSTA